MSAAIKVPGGPGPFPVEFHAPDVLFTDDTPTLPVRRQPRTPAAPSADSRSLDPGTELCSRYVLEEVIGCGGTSLVFRARDLHRSLLADGAPKPIAIKVIRPELRGEPWALNGLQREFRQMEQLSHPNIVRVFDLCRDGDIWFITMQLIAGATAKAWSATSHDPATALRIVNGCCAALEHAHSLGIVHADLKPTNVIIDEIGRARLIDFGSLRNATPAFSSPQILMGMEAQERDDVFGIACLSYALLSGGGHPFGGRPAFEDGQLKSAPTNAHGIASEMFEVIERGLSGERVHRHASVREFRMALAAAASDSRPTPNILTDIESKALVPWTAPPKVGQGLGWTTTIQTSLLVLGIAVATTAFYFSYGAARTMANTTAMAAPIPLRAPEIAPIVQAPALPVAAARPMPASNGVVSFATTNIQAAAAQPVIAIGLRRSGRTASRGEFRWRVTTPGAGMEPGYVGERTGLARFLEGQTVRTLFIPLINTPNSTSRGPKAFTVTLEPVAGGSALGSPASMTVAVGSTSGGGGGN